MRYEVGVTLQVDTARENEAVTGRVQSRYGTQTFSGWLELLGQLEALIDHARANGAPTPGERR